MRVEPRTDNVSDNDGFETYARRRTKHRERLTKFVTVVTMLRIFPSRKASGNVIIRLNLEDDEFADAVLEDGFWPMGYYVYALVVHRRSIL